MSERLGALVPDNNHVIERDFRKLGTELEIVRMPVAGTGPEHLVAMAAHARAGIEDLRRCGAGILLYACMSTSLVPPFDWDDEFESLAGPLPAVTAARAVTDALARAGARRVSVVSGYTGEILDHVRDYMARAGITVVSNASLHVEDLDEFARVPAEALAATARAHVALDADAVCIAGTDIPAVEAAEVLARELPIPVVTANGALHAAGVRAGVAG